MIRAHRIPLHGFPFDLVYRQDSESIVPTRVGNSHRRNHLTFAESTQQLVD